MKKRILTAVTLACSMLMSALVCAVPTHAQDTNLVFHQNKTSIKLGETLKGVFSYENAVAGVEQPYLGLEVEDGSHFLGIGSGGPINAPESGNVFLYSVRNDRGTNRIDKSIKPGNVTINTYAYYSDFRNGQAPLSTFSLEIEEPVIQTNLESIYYVGEQVEFKTELSNTGYTKGNIQEKKDAVHNHQLYDKITYQASTEILEGQDIVTKENEDYSNALESSEKLTFTGTGTVKIKVTYNPVNLWGDYNRISDYNQTLDDCYHGEKIFTFNVTTRDAIKENENYKKLNDTISELENLDLYADKYTDESWLSYTASLADAKQILEKERLTEEDCINALNMLISAKENLADKSGEEASINEDIEEEIKEETREKVPETGDDNIIVLWMLLLICATVSGIMMIRTREKRQL